MQEKVIKLLIKQGFDETEAEQMASVMGEIELFEVIEQGGVQRETVGEKKMARFLFLLSILFLLTMMFVDFKMGMNYSPIPQFTDEEMHRICIEEGIY